MGYGFNLAMIMQCSMNESMRLTAIFIDCLVCFMSVFSVSLNVQ